jgi:hypothetical protein
MPVNALDSAKRKSTIAAGSIRSFPNRVRWRELRVGERSERILRPRGKRTERGDLVATFHERETQRRGLGSWSRTRWLIVAVVLAAIAVAVVLLVLYTGGGSGGGGGGGY